MDMKPFEEFDEPHEPATWTALGNGEYHVTLGKPINNPWTIGVIECDTLWENSYFPIFHHFWDVDGSEGIQKITELIARVEEVYADELAAAAIEHELSGHDDTRIVDLWPIESILRSLRNVKVAWEAEYLDMAPSRETTQ